MKPPKRHWRTQSTCRRRHAAFQDVLVKCFLLAMRLDLLLAASPNQTAHQVQLFHNLRRGMCPHIWKSVRVTDQTVLLDGWDRVYRLHFLNRVFFSQSIVFVFCYCIVSPDDASLKWWNSQLYSLLTIVDAISLGNLEFIFHQLPRDDFLDRISYACHIGKRDNGVLEIWHPVYIRRERCRCSAMFV